MPLSSREAAEERALLGLRTVEGARLADLAMLGRAPDAGAFADLIADGFLEIAGDRVRATPTGRPLLDALLKALLT